MNLSEETDFIFSKPKNRFLKEIVLSYFYVNLDVSEVFLKTEYIIPYPRVTFGYFFDKPFNAYNISRNEIKQENSLASKVIKDQIIVTPTTNKIQILGAHLKPYALALFTNKSISNLHWSMTPFEILDIKAKKFEERLRKLNTVSKLFDLVERSFLDALLVKDFKIIDRAVDIIDKSKPLITVSELAEELNLTVRTLRNYFQNFIGCSPKDYLQIVRFKRAAYEMLKSKQKLTNTGYNADFYDQAHFINSFKSAIGKAPKEIKDDIENLRFLHIS